MQISSFHPEFLVPHSKVQIDRTFPSAKAKEHREKHQLHRISWKETQKKHDSIHCGWIGGLLRPTNTPRGPFDRDWPWKQCTIALYSASTYQYATNATRTQCCRSIWCARHTTIYVVNRKNFISIHTWAMHGWFVKLGDGSKLENNYPGETLALDDLGGCGWCRIETLFYVNSWVNSIYLLITKKEILKEERRRIVNVLTLILHSNQLFLNYTEL